MRLDKGFIRKSLCEYIYKHLFYKYIVQSDLTIFMNEIVAYINMFYSEITNWITFQDYVTLVVTVICGKLSSNNNICN